MLSVPVATMKVETPEISLAAAFAEYGDQISDALRKRMRELFESGALQKAALAELERQLPQRMQKTVESMLYNVDFAPVLKPIIEHAVASLAIELRR
jgi:hypothetical protein